MLMGLYQSLIELKGKPDEQVRKLVRQAKFRRGDALWVMPLLAGLAAAAAWGVIGWGIIEMVMFYRQSAANAGNTTGLPTPAVPLPPMIVPIVVGCGILAFVAAAVIARYSMVVRSVRFLVNKAGCPYCRFSLVGLTPSAKGGTGAKPIVRCPECGQLVSLFDHGIVPQDLVPERERYRAYDGAGPMGAYAADAEYYRRRVKSKLAGRSSAARSASAPRPRA